MVLLQVLPLAVAPVPEPWSVAEAGAMLHLAPRHARPRGPPLAFRARARGQHARQLAAARRARSHLRLEEGDGGDYLYGDHREPYRKAGPWGIMRVFPSDEAELVPLPKREMGQWHELVARVCLGAVVNPCPYIWCPCQSARRGLPVSHNESGKMPKLVKDPTTTPTRERRFDNLNGSRITVFHMDEYVGIDAKHPASYRHFLQKKVVQHVKPAAFHGVIGDAPDTQAEITRYERLLSESSIKYANFGLAVA